MPQKQNHTNDKFLERDIRKALERYPDLKRRLSMQRQQVLEGNFPIKSPEGDVVDVLDLRIIYLRTFPHAYPLVCETGGRFSRNHGQMHINGDGSLCMNSPQQERIDCYSGIDSLSFFDQVLIPNLAWRLCVLDGIPFERKELGHGAAGIFQSYQELLALKAPADIYRFITMFINNNLPERNFDCFCGSARKYKACHGQYESRLYKIGIDMLKTHLPMIYSLIK